MKISKIILVLTGSYLIVYVTFSYCSHPVVTVFSGKGLRISPLMPFTRPVACTALVSQPDDPPQNTYTTVTSGLDSVVASGTVSNATVSTTTTTL